MTSTGSDQRAYQMTMNKGDPSYEMSPPARAVRRDAARRFASRRSSKAFVH